MANYSDRPRVEGRQGYNFPSGRRVEYDSSLVSRIPRSPAHDANNIDDIVDPTLVQPSQFCLFEHSNPSGEQVIPRSPDAPVVENTQNQLLDLKKQMGFSIVRTEQLCHRYKFLTSCREKGIIPKGLTLDKLVNPMRGHITEGITELQTEVRTILNDV